jgi:hypothetical protein
MDLARLQFDGQVQCRPGCWNTSTKAIVWSVVDPRRDRIRDHAAIAGELGAQTREQAVARAIAAGLLAI